jgi:hypothetical protein
MVSKLQVDIRTTGSENFPDLLREISVEVEDGNTKGEFPLEGGVAIWEVLNGRES